MFNFLILILSVFTLSANASVVISSTRVIYPENAKEVSVKLMNKGSKPVLVQSWIDDGDTNKSIDEISVPFILTPPINRIDAGKGQTLRIINTDYIKNNEESLFWLNVLEIPALDPDIQGKNHIQMAFRTRIKVFYRPEGLGMSSSEAIKNINIKFLGNGVEVSNPTPYYMNISNLNVNVNNKDYLADGDLIEPNSKGMFFFKDLKRIPNGESLIVNYINDYGAIKSVSHVVESQ